MGPELGDTGNYGVFTPNSPEEEQQDQPLQEANGGNPFGRPSAQAKLTPAQLAKVVGAMRQEWRTPPLWGVRDSGPYLHDGRADTLEQAIAFHGGQAASTTAKFFHLKPEERQQVIAFLKSLTAPDQKALEPSELVKTDMPAGAGHAPLLAHEEVPAWRRGLSRSRGLNKQPRNWVVFYNRRSGAIAAHLFVRNQLLVDTYSRHDRNLPQGERLYAGGLRIAIGRMFRGVQRHESKDRRMRSLRHFGVCGRFSIGTLNQA